MSRYRMQLGPRDDTDDLVGDSSFVGVNMVDSPETLGAGYVQEAVNHQFTRQTGDPRGGIVCLPQHASMPLGQLYGETIYVDQATRLEWLAGMAQTSMNFFRQGAGVRTVGFPVGYTAGVEICTLVQAGNSLYIFQKGAVPAVWDGNWSGAFVYVFQAPFDTFLQIPNASTAVYFQDRLWLPYTADDLAVSLTSNFELYDGTTGTFGINRGGGDELLTVAPFGNQSLVVFKTRSIHKFLGVTTSLTNLSKDEVTRSHGLIAQRAVAQAGDRLYYLASDRALRALDLTLELDLKPVDLPISSKIQPWLDRVSWQFAWRSILHHDEERLFLAVPMDGAPAPNKILVYNLIRAEWDGLWEFDPALGPYFRNFARLDVYGDSRLCAITLEGRAYLMDEGEYDIQGANFWPIATRLKTRGYMPNARWSRGALAEVHLGTYSPNVSITVETDGVAENMTLAENLTYDRTRSHYLGGKSDYLNLLGNAGAAGREDYSVVPPEMGGIDLDAGGGVDLAIQQMHKVTRPIRTQGRWHAVTVTNSDGIAAVRQVSLLARDGDRAGRRPI